MYNITHNIHMDLFDQVLAWLQEWHFQYTRHIILSRLYSKHLTDIQWLVFKNEVWS